MADERIYRIYITDALKTYLGLNRRYADIFIPTETRKPEEIINNISNKISRLGGGEDG